MVLCVQWHALNVGAGQVAGFLKALLGGVMAAFTQRLPIGLIPEEIVVASMRRFVIDHGRRLDLVLCQAKHAKRIALQEMQTRFSPASIVRT